MRKYICLLIIVLSLNLGEIFAHQDFYRTKDFGNVKVGITTGFEYEEINKVNMFGQLAEKLSKELNYSEPILLDFSHFYVKYCDPDYFISYDKGNIEYYWGEWITDSSIIEDNAIVIRQVARQFDAQTTLKLLEYAILNLKNIKSTQRQITYNKNYCNWKINTIDTLIIKKILNMPNSNLLNNILKTKINRPEKEHFGNNFSYYWQNNRYFVFWKRPNMPDTVLIELENIYDFNKNGNIYVMVFDSDSSFHYVGKYDNIFYYGDSIQVSQRHVMEKPFPWDSYEPFKVGNLGNGKIFIYLGYQPRILVYLTDEDKLIQDLDKLLREKVKD